MPSQRAFLAIQCTTDTGKNGTFLYSQKTDTGFAAVSPVCRDCVELFVWAKANGWQRVANSQDPVGEYEQMTA